MASLATYIESSLIDRLFGYDIFISYGRGEANQYVAALAEALKSAGFSVFLDSEVYTAGIQLAQETQRRVLGVFDRIRWRLVACVAIQRNAPVRRRRRLDARLCLR